MDDRELAERLTNIEQKIDLLLETLFINKNKETVPESHDSTLNVSSNFVEKQNSKLDIRNMKFKQKEI